MEKKTKTKKPTKKNPPTNPQTDTIYFKADNLKYIVVESYRVAGICFYDPYRVFFYMTHPRSHIYKQCYKH